MSAPRDFRPYRPTEGGAFLDLGVDADAQGQWSDAEDDPRAPGDETAAPGVRTLSRAVPRLRARLGERVRVLRRARGLSQEALARSAGLSARFVSRLEQGRTSISLDNLYHVAFALDAPLSWLMHVDLTPRAPRRTASPPISGIGDRSRGALRTVPAPARNRRASRFSPRNVRNL